MPLYLNDDQTMLQDTVRPFMADEGSIEKQLRHWRDRDCKDGFGHELWKKFAEMGFTGILVDEGDGGLEMGHVEAGIVLEEIGRNLTPSPFLTTAVAGVTALQDAGEETKGKYLPGILSGDTVLALALDESAKFRPSRIATTAERSGNGFKLNGKKQFVIQGGSADMLIVAARTGGDTEETDGITLFAVDKDAAGLSMESARLVDSAMAAHVELVDVEVTADAVIGEVDQGWDVLTRVMHAGQTGAAAEMVGVGSGAMDRTVNYLKERKQFGQLIGSFQALQHRAAHLYSEMEIARATVMKAQQLLDENDDGAPLMVSVAKAKAGQAVNLAVREGVQMHGGIGMTDEYDIGLFMKRDRALAEFMGDTNYHINRVAEMNGY